MLPKPNKLSSEADIRRYLIALTEELERQLQRLEDMINGEENV